METITSLVQFILHIDRHLVLMVQEYQFWTYLILFAIIFAETGLVVTPFLPGDSLLFATGAIVARPEAGLSLVLMGLVLMAGAFLGDITNYKIGSFVGTKAFDGNIRFLKKEYLVQTQQFYAKHGGKTIIYARFVPIIRTFAPFVAGVGSMKFQKYISFGVIGSFIWVFGFLSLGYFFGNLPIVKQNFTLVALGIILFSVFLPLLGKFINRAS